ncbi:hypothetical protein CPJCM30710_11030 [Clostridium polyendosporum]|uniref:ScoMcrA-like N-terminal head domain-containing protein n=1 Tax=Clostridium polyendosporum TaxID=69208 RepID=A0A919RXS6_9CLOT|nr:HNH endonuclease [Clostridium polyendosporum]GIM28437.1 hypothetical protein CPJCM30710_11030 [Clostridium polyendosporum]
MIPENISKEHILKAIEEIDENGVPQERLSTKFSVLYREKLYPPKYLISIANKYVNGEELSPSLFSGGDETNNFLFKRGFKIVDLHSEKDIFPIKLFSWTILSQNVFIKAMDRSSFIHHGTGIPREIRQYFNVSDLKQGENKNIVLIHNNVKYYARIEIDNMDSPRSRLFWKVDFANLINSKLPEWYDLYKKNDEPLEDLPQLRFEKLGEKDDHYFVDFINPIDIVLDIEAEKQEEQGLIAEGAVKYYYGKKYERRPENRRRAIEIHGAVCSLCGFDFEKVYGKRGSGFIEIHHAKQLSTLEEEQFIDPVTDLIPVCSNCHRMIHRRNDNVLTIEEMKSIINKNKII